MGIDDYRRATRDISTHVGKALNKNPESTFAAYVVDVIDDPKRVYAERKATILKFLHNKEAFDYLPGKSIIFAKINSLGNMKGSKVFYALPFMSPHFSQPINAGEMAWVFNDNGSYYWITRQTSLSNLEDINYTSGQREINPEDTSSVSSNIDIAMGVEQTDATKEPDFPRITSTNDVDLQRLLTFYDSHSSRSFIGEPVPIVKPKGNEFLLQGGNNSSIKLSNNNSLNAGNIELTAGITANSYNSSRKNERGYEETDRAVLEDQNVNEGESNYIEDSSRVFISAGDDSVNRFIYGDAGDEEPEISDDDVTSFVTNPSLKYVPTIASKTTDYFVITNSEGGIHLRNNGGSHISIKSSQINVISDRVVLSGTNDNLEPATKSKKLQSLLEDLTDILKELVIPTSVGPAPAAGDPKFIAAIAIWVKRLSEIESISVEHD